MPADRIGTRIEALIGKGQWKPAQAVIEKQLGKEPDDHWLWARLAGVKYEQRDYQAALNAAEKSLEIVPDCPLAGWSKACALEMLGKVEEAADLYMDLFRRGLQELTNPDDDAHECWEGPDWTAALMADCSFRFTGCLVKMGRRDRAIELYQDLLSLQDMGIQGIYSRDDVLERLNKLVPSKKAKREAAMKKVERELIPG